jgi:hypothetical protein
LSDSAAHSVVYRSEDVSDPAAPACASEALRMRGGAHHEPWTAPSNASASGRRKRWMGGAAARSKRAAAIDPHKTTCMLYLQADHLFHQKFGSEEACIEVMTRHVQRVNSIYQGTGTTTSIKMFGVLKNKIVFPIPLPLNSFTPTFHLPPLPL